jgi:hypothetical protein
MSGSTIEVVDRGRRLAFSFEDILRYHGPTSQTVRVAAIRHRAVAYRTGPR